MLPLESFLFLAELTSQAPRPGCRAHIPSLLAQLQGSHPKPHAQLQDMQLDLVFAFPNGNFPWSHPFL